MRIIPATLLLVLMLISPAFADHVDRNGSIICDGKCPPPPACSPRSDGTPQRC